MDDQVALVAEIRLLGVVSNAQFWRTSVKVTFIYLSEQALQHRGSQVVCPSRAMLSRWWHRLAMSLMRTDPCATERADQAARSHTSAAPLRDRATPELRDECAAKELRCRKLADRKARAGYSTVPSHSGRRQNLGGRRVATRQAAWWPVARAPMGVPGLRSGARRAARPREPSPLRRCGSWAGQSQDELAPQCALRHSSGAA